MQCEYLINKICIKNIFMSIWTIIALTVLTKKHEIFLFAILIIIKLKKIFKQKENVCVVPKISFNLILFGRQSFEKIKTVLNFLIIMKCFPVFTDPKPPGSFLLWRRIYRTFGFRFFSPNSTHQSELLYIFHTDKNSENIKINEQFEWNQKVEEK